MAKKMIGFWRKFSCRHIVTVLKTFYKTFITINEDTLLQRNRGKTICISDVVGKACTLLGTILQMTVRTNQNMH